MDESRIIIDWKEQGDDYYEINVVGYRNFKQHFSEAFYSIEKPLSVLSVSDSSISGEDACNSATSTLLKYLTNIIGKSVKTRGHIFAEEELIKSNITPNNYLVLITLVRKIAWQNKNLARQSTDLSRKII